MKNVAVGPAGEHIGAGGTPDTGEKHGRIADHCRPGAAVESQNCAIAADGKDIEEAMDRMETFFEDLERERG